MNRPASAIDLTVSTPGLALGGAWEVLPDTHGSDHYPILTSILPLVAETQPNCDPSQSGVFQGRLGTVSRFVHGGDHRGRPGGAGPLDSFVEHLTKGAYDSIPGQWPSPRNRTLGLMKNAGGPWGLGERWTGECAKVENSEGRPSLLSEGRRLGDSSTSRNVGHGRSVSRGCRRAPLLGMYGIEWERYLVKISALPSNI